LAESGDIHDGYWDLWDLIFNVSEERVTRMKLTSLLSFIAVMVMIFSPVSAIYLGCTNGTAATINVNYTFTGAAGTSALVSNIGTAQDALLDFTIPTGAAGPAGADNLTAGPEGPQGINGTPGSNGAAGAPGLAATIDVNYTFTGSPGSVASVTNVGSTTTALLDFIIPTGADGSAGTPGINGTNGSNGSNGIDGTNGTSATVAANYTFTGLAGTNAIVTNVGTSTAALFDFTIPQGAKGEKGDQGDPNAYNASYDVLIRNDYVYTGNQSYVLTSNGSYILGTNASYFLTDGSRAMAANITMGSNYITGLLSGTSGGSVVNKTYVDALPIYNASYLTSTYNASYITSTYNATYDAKPSVVWNTSYENKANITQYAYVTLMVGSAMYPTTNPPSNFNQVETTTNKNNYIYANFTAASSNNTQWIVDMPSDWNGGNIVGNFLWTTSAGTGTANFTLSGYRFADNINLDTALPLVGYSVDTVQTVGYMHVSPDTSAAAVTGTGNTIIFKVGRGADSLTYPAQLMGVRIKYIKTIGAA
jgi:hypothetical protein